MQRNTLALIGVVVLGVLALGVTAMSMLGGRGKQVEPVPTAVPDQKITYWVAVREIPRRTRVTKSMLIERIDSTQTPLPNAITDPEQVLDMVALKTIPAQKVLTTTMFTPAIAAVIKANMPVPGGLRAVAIWVNPEQTAAGLVDVGDRIDVLVQTKLKVKTQIGDSDIQSARTIAQYLEVLAVDKSIVEAAATPTPVPTPGAPPGPPPPPAPPKPAVASNENRTRIIVAASPAIAERLVAANSSGTLHVTVRNPADRPILPASEAFEYPLQFIRNPKAAELAAEREKEEYNYRLNKKRADDAADRAERFRPRMDSGPQVSPFMPGVNTIKEPPPVRPVEPKDTSKEVTVVRGTEKTRVLVEGG